MQDICLFYLAYPLKEIFQTMSGISGLELKMQTVSAEFDPAVITTFITTLMWDTYFCSNRRHFASRPHPITSRRPSFSQCTEMRWNNVKIA